LEITVDPTELDAQMWDGQIEADAASGKLDKLF
jgi:hypothetical protein